MKVTKQRIVIVSCILLAGILLTGCDTAATDSPFFRKPKPPGPPQQLRISALSEFVYLPGTPQPQLKIMAELLDAAEQSVRQPCIWRFELYHFVPRSAKIRGHRVKMWPEVDLTQGQSDDAHWDSFLKSYEFYVPLDLEHELQGGKKYVLEVTAMTDQRRYNDLFEIIYLPEIGQ